MNLIYYDFPDRVKSSPANSVSSDWPTLIKIAYYSCSVNPTESYEPRWWTCLSESYTVFIKGELSSVSFKSLSPFVGHRAFF